MNTTQFFTTICGSQVSSQSFQARGAVIGTPWICGYKVGHDGPHSWAVDTRPDAKVLPFEKPGNAESTHESQP